MNRKTQKLIRAAVKSAVERRTAKLMDDLLFAEGMRKQAEAQAVEERANAMRLRKENSELIDMLFVRGDKIRELLLYKKLTDDGHAYRLEKRIQEISRDIKRRK